MKCPKCKKKMKDVLIDRYYNKDGIHYLITGVPAKRCETCMEDIISGSTVNRIRDLLNSGDATIIKINQIDYDHKLKEEVYQVK
jgi:YgiT-type zinc finger domain-containing protein